MIILPQIEDALEKIKSLECSAGELRNRIAGIFEECGIADSNEVTVEKYDGISINGSVAFHASIPGTKNKAVTVLAGPGMDGSLTKVNDAYVE